MLKAALHKLALGLAIDQPEGPFLSRLTLSNPPSCINCLIEHRIGSKPFKTEELLDLAIQIADALEAAHPEGRSSTATFKPANIVVPSLARRRFSDWSAATTDTVLYLWRNVRRSRDLREMPQHVREASVRFRRQASTYFTEPVRHRSDGFLLQESSSKMSYADTARVGWRRTIARDSAASV